MFVADIYSRFSPETCMQSRGTAARPHSAAESSAAAAHGPDVSHISINNGQLYHKLKLKES